MAPGRSRLAITENSRGGSRLVLLNGPPKQNCKTGTRTKSKQKAKEGDRTKDQILLNVEALEERIAPDVLSGGKPAHSANPEGTAKPRGKRGARGSKPLCLSKVQFVGYYRPTMFHAPLGHQRVKSISMLHSTHRSILTLCVSLVNINL